MVKSSRSKIRPAAIKIANAQFPGGRRVQRSDLAEIAPVFYHGYLSAGACDRGEFGRIQHHRRRFVAGAAFPRSRPARHDLGEESGTGLLHRRARSGGIREFSGMGETCYPIRSNRRIRGCES